MEDLRLEVPGLLVADRRCGDMVTLEMFGIAMAAMFAPAEATTVATSDSQASVKAIEAETSRVAPLAALL